MGETREKFEQEAKWAIAVKLYEMKRLSSGMAASILGIDRLAFLLKLNDYYVAMIDLTDINLHCLQLFKLDNRGKNIDENTL